MTDEQDSTPPPLQVLQKVGEVNKINIVKSLTEAVKDKKFSN
jgi:hypothetical protein